MPRISYHLSKGCSCTSWQTVEGSKNTEGRSWHTILTSPHTNSCSCSTTLGNVHRERWPAFEQNIIQQESKSHSLTFLLVGLLGRWNENRYISILLVHKKPLPNSGALNSKCWGLTPVWVGWGSGDLVWTDVRLRFPAQCSGLTRAALAYVHSL